MKVPPSRIKRFKYFRLYTNDYEESKLFLGDCNLFMNCVVPDNLHTGKNLI